MGMVNRKTNHESALASEQVNKYESYVSNVWRLSFYTNARTAVSLMQIYSLLL